MNNITRAKILVTVFLVLGYNFTTNVLADPITRQKINQERSMSDQLSLRQQAIPLIASYMASSQMEKLNSALNKGLDAGLSINETKEILIQLYAYCGFPRSLNALNEFMKVVDERKQRGITDIQGKEPTGEKPVGVELRNIGIANQTKIAGRPALGPIYQFAPVINEFLQDHLFGDIFSRDNLDWQSRELATVGALAATAGVEPQLRSHVMASLRVGISEKQILEIGQILRDHDEDAAANRVEYALQQAKQ